MPVSVLVAAYNEETCIGSRVRELARRPPPAVVRRIAEVPGVELHDVRPFLAKSGVMVVPLRIGGGSRLKILEATASGLPVISTRVGAEGLELVPGEHYLAADEPELMSDALVSWIRRPSTGAGHGRAQPGRCPRTLRLGYFSKTARASLVRLPRWLIPVNY